MTKVSRVICLHGTIMHMKHVNPENAPRTIESSPDKGLSLEYYRNKNNGIERHLDDALKVCLAKLSLMSGVSVRMFIEDIPLRKKFTHEPAIDPLRMKPLLKISGVPRVNDVSTNQADQVSTPEEFAVQVTASLDDSVYEQNINSFMTKEQLSSHYESVRAQEEEWRVYVERTRELHNEGKSNVMVYGSQEVIMTSCTDFDCVARINIKVPSTGDIPHSIVRKLADKFVTHETIIASDFQMKSLTGNPRDRDSVIIYTSEGSFPEIAKIVREHFRDDFHYHDRHADPAVFGGVALEDKDGSKFPAIRVSAEPESLSKRFNFMWTFNDLQATLLGEALVAYISQYYDGDKDAMLQDFISQYDSAYEVWYKHFPTCYQDAVMMVAGNDADARNIAFFKL